MVINTNLPAQSSARLLSDSSNQLSKSLARLSSGSKIVSPEDDAAGLAVSMRMESQMHRLDAARSNLGNAISFSQTQDGFLQKVSKALDRMSELSVLAQDNTKNSNDVTLYDNEFTVLKNYITDLGTKDFNGVSLFGSTGLNVTTDSEGGAGLAMTAADLSTAVSGATGSALVSGGASAAQTAVKAAIISVAAVRGSVGSNISVMSSYQDQLGTLNDNLAAANSRISDVDVATESATYAKYNILVQAGTAMLAQANQAPQAVLKLLG